MGSSAGRELAARLNAPVRIRMDRTCGSAANIAQARHQRVAHPAGCDMLEVRTLPAVQKKDHAEK